MKTLSFLDTRVGRSPAAVLLELNSQADQVELKPGLSLIVAPNGRGKTTLLQTIAGVLPLRGGEFRLGDKKLLPERDVLYISEYLTFPKFIYPREWIEFVSQRNSRNVDLAPWIEGFSLQDPIRRFLGRLSQGERRKMTWLAAHASQKPVLLLDEPLDGLDLLAIRAAREMVETWRKEGRIVLIVAHQVGELLDLSDEVYLIRDRKLRTWRQAFSGEYRGLSAEQFRQQVLGFYS